MVLDPNNANAQDRDICAERDGARSVDACSRVIANGQLLGKDLATIYVLRASIYRSEQEYDRAVDDMSHAIDLLSNIATKDVVASAYVTRGSFYSLKGDTAKALADYQHALTLDSSNTQAADAAKNLQMQLTSALSQISNSSASNELAVPNQPLPPETPIPTEILQLVETNPFFANAPPVRIGTYSTASTTTSTTSAGGGPVVSSNEDNVFVTWLRVGLVRTDSTTTLSTTSMGHVEPSSAQTEQILAANGFIRLGYRTTGSTRLGQSVTIEKTLRIQNLAGHIFPMELDNQFSYERTSEETSTFGGRRDRYESTWSQSCTVAKKLNANLFHPDLSGFAWVAECTNRLKNIAATLTTPSREVFFDDLGYWITADPVELRQQLMDTGSTGNGILAKGGAKFTTSTTGTHTLRSFSKVR